MPAQVGVITQQRDAPLTAAELVPDGSTYFVAGLFDRGPTTTYEVCGSIARVTEVFGERVSYSDSYDDLVDFFAEGGSRAVVTRAVGPAPVKATLTVVGVRYDAKNEGAWGNSLAVQHVAGSVIGFKVILTLSGVVVEQWDNLVTPQDVVARASGSQYILPVALNTTALAVAAQTSLASGADDRASIVWSTLAPTILARFPKALGSGVVALPGQDPAVVGNALIAHAAAYDRIAIPHAVKGATKANAESSASALVQANGNAATLLWPHKKIRDAAGERTIPPTGMYAGCRARIIALKGAPGTAVAGEKTISRTASGLELELPLDSDYDSMRAKGITPLQNLRGGGQAGIRFYGAGTLSNDPNRWPRLKDKDLGNYISALCQPVLEPFVWDDVDGEGKFFMAIKGTLEGVLMPLARAGIVYAKKDSAGNLIDPGFTVDVAGATTLAMLSADTVAANIGYRPSPTAALIIVTVTRQSLQS